jgi:hypothetical protein
MGFAMKKKTLAKIKGSTLTVGFHSAKSPLIWRFDLDRNHSFTFSLQGDEGDWELGVTSVKGDFSPVAHFDEREDAEEALDIVEKTLSRKGSGTTLVLKALGYVGLLAASTALVVFIIATALTHRAHDPHAALTANPSHPVVQEQDGVPMSADDVLQPPR